MDDTYGLRKPLADIVAAINDEDEDNEPDINIQLTVNDITGSLGVWGISQ